MTTIATDGKCVAFDSRITGGGYFHMGDSADKVVQVGGILIGAAGRHEDCDAFKEWVVRTISENNVERPTIVDKEAFAGLIVTDGKLMYYTSMLRPYAVQAPFAIGAGADLAIGAILAGKHPIDAVKIATMRDVLTGGDVRCLPAAAAEAYYTDHDRHVAANLAASALVPPVPPGTLAQALVAPGDLAALTRDFWHAVEPWFDNAKEAKRNGDSGDRMMRSAPVDGTKFDYANGLRKKIGTLLVAAGLMDGDTDT